MEKISELSITSLKLEDGIKLAIIHNSLLERYRHLVVGLEKDEKIGFNKPMARLLDEAETRISVGVLQLEHSILKRTIHGAVEASSEYLTIIPYNPKTTPSYSH